MHRWLTGADIVSFVLVTVSTAVRKHHDQGNSEKKKAFNLSWLMVLKGLSIIIMAANMELER